MPDNNEDINAQRIKQLEEQQKIMKQIAEIEAIAKQYMTKEAIERYATLKVAYPDIAFNAVSLIAKAAKMQQLKQRITDEQFKTILNQINPNKQNFRIIK